MIKYFKILFFKSRLKHHYLSARQIENNYDCGGALLEQISPDYPAHMKKVTEYKLKLRELGEPI